MCRWTYIVSFAAELPERLDVEPGALVTGRVQRNPHGVLLQQSGKTLVHRQVLITLNVQELSEKNQDVFKYFKLNCHGLSYHIIRLLSLQMLQKKSDI